MRRLYFLYFCRFLSAAVKTLVSFSDCSAAVHTVFSSLEFQLIHCAKPYTFNYVSRTLFLQLYRWHNSIFTLLPTYTVCSHDHIMLIMHIRELSSERLFIKATLNQTHHIVNSINVIEQHQRTSCIDFIEQ